MTPASRRSYHYYTSVIVGVSVEARFDNTSAASLAILDVLSRALRRMQHIAVLIAPSWVTGLGCGLLPAFAAGGALVTLPGLLELQGYDSLPDN